jgi:tRNA (guanine37-N1)-methyltransferase
MAMAKLSFHFLTLFPEVFAPILASSLLGKAQANSHVSFEVIQIRDFSTDKHRTVDDTPYGGGEGMLLKVDVLHAAWKSVREKLTGKTRTLLMSPQGPLLTQEKSKQLVTFDHLIVVCGHYEGVDERFIELCAAGPEGEEISVGDYVLTGGELPALVLADAVTRLIPGVVGNDCSVANDSLEAGLLKYPQYTRPREYEGKAVPEILLSGDHGAIEKWRRTEMERRTRKKRPDLKTKRSS